MITALHGFLGLPADWDFLRAVGFDVVTSPLDDIPPTGDTLLGYSMGGRLAVQALLRGAKYERAVLVSTGLGVDDESERGARRKRDEVWAKRFESEPWESLMESWHAQPIFGGHIPIRDESQFDRTTLARTLRDWSPAAHEPFGRLLGRIDVPVLVIAGERDGKYVDVATRAAALLPRGELWICPGAAHRVPWEQPERFVERLREFVPRP